MLILINVTGLKRFYLKPKFDRNSNKAGVWYWSATWLIVEFSVYSKLMGARMIQELNTIKPATQPQGTGGNHG